MKLVVAVLPLLLLSGCAGKHHAPPQRAVANLDKCTKLVSVDATTVCKPIPNTTHVLCNGTYVLDVMCYQVLKEKR